MFRKKTKVESYRTERKLKRGIEKMARKGWVVREITAYKRGRNVFQTTRESVTASIIGLGKTSALFSKKADSFIVVYERSQ
jgi:predicted GNAT family acetyltransferase